MPTTETDFPITKCPPAPPRHGLSFDEHVEIKHHPVEARFTGHGEAESTRLDFSDYFRMGCVGQKLASHRRLDTPEWAFDPAKLRSLIVRTMEKRAQFHYPQAGTDAERLARAQTAIERYRPDCDERLTRMCKELVALKKNPDTDQRAIKAMQAEVESLDTFLQTSSKPDRGAAMLAGIVHGYYSLGLNSVEVAAGLHIKPPNVRQILFGMHETWRRMKTETETIYYPKNPKLCLVCGAPCPVRCRKYCSKQCHRVAVISQRVRRKKTHLNFCSPDCKLQYQVRTRNGEAFIPFSATKVEQTGNRSYDSYVDFCRRMDAQPMPFAEWNAGVSPVAGWKNLPDSSRKMDRPMLHNT